MKLSKSACFFNSSLEKIKKNCNSSTASNEINSVKYFYNYLFVTANRKYQRIIMFLININVQEKCPISHNYLQNKVSN